MILVKTVVLIGTARVKLATRDPFYQPDLRCGNSTFDMKLCLLKMHMHEPDAGANTRTVQGLGTIFKIRDLRCPYPQWRTAARALQAP